MKRIDPPVQAIQDNVVAGRDLDDLWAVFKLEGRSYRAESLTTRQTIVGDLELFAARIQADFQILRVSKRWDPDAYIARLEANPPINGHPDLWLRYLGSQKAVLADAAVWAPEAYLVVRLADSQKDLHGYVSEVLDMSIADARAWVAEVRAEYRQRKEPRDAINLEPVAARLLATERRVTTSIAARPATEEEVQWLVRRVFGRGFGDPRIVPAKTFRLPWNQRTRSMEWWLSETLVRPMHGHLEVTDGFESVYQAGICLGELGESRPFTRECELMFSAVEEFPFPVDASLNVRWVSASQAADQARTRWGKNKASVEDADESTFGAMEDEIEDAARARELHGRVSGTKEPVLFGTLSLSVVADERKELAERISALRDELPHEWYSPKPRADQLQLAFSFFPGQRARVTGYERLYTCENVGAMVPHATHRVGADTHRGGKPTHAMYFARTIHGDQPVFFDVYEGWERDTAPTVALLGSLGGGKSMALQLLEYQGFIQGARIVDCDPKGDHKLYLHPDVAPHAQTIILGPDPEHRGKLDPLRVAPDGERQTAAATFLNDVTGAVDPLIQAAIHGAIGRVIRTDGERACCASVVAALQEGMSEAERTAGEMLGHYADGGIVALGFARPEDPLPQQASEQFTYLNVRALDAPHVETVRSEMSIGELHGRAVMQLVALYAMRILGRDRARAKVLGFDETSFIRTVGARLLDQLSRWSRSEKALPILSTQMLADISAQDNLIGHYFQFGMKSREQAMEALEVLELDPAGPLLPALTQRYGLPGHKGECVFRDLQGRSEEIRVDPGHLLPHLRTSAPADEPNLELVA